MHHSHLELVCHAEPPENRNPTDFQESLRQTVCSSKWLVLNPIRLAGFTRSLTEEPKLNQPDDQNIKELWADFLSAIETGRRPISDIEEIHRSTNLSLPGMLPYKLGRSVLWDAEKGSVRRRPANQRDAKAGIPEALGVPGGVASVCDS
jgi:hypothetical protein